MIVAVVNVIIIIKAINVVNVVIMMMLNGYRETVGSKTVNFIAHANHTP